MKPYIFFSHSSKDADRIKPIKDRIIEATGNSIKIFVSSDGASIPLGKNWLKEIEDALTNCRLMFVWVTRNSIKSNWIFFESGFAYSKGIKVVPIGFDGIKLEDVPAPLNILQGFNINSASSLNNIIAVINKEFDLSFPNIFDIENSKQLIDGSLLENSSELLTHVDAIKCTFFPRITKKENETIEINLNWMKIIEKVLSERNEPYTKSHDSKYFGLGFQIYSESENNLKFPTILIDPLSINRIKPLLSELNSQLYSNNYDKIILKIILQKSYVLPDDHYLISSRLIDTEVKFETAQPNLLFKFRDILFRINIRNNSLFDKHKELVVIIDQKENKAIPLLSLIHLLIEQKIIIKI